MYKEYMYLSFISSLVLYANVDKRVSDHDITFNFGVTYFEQYKTTNLLSQEFFTNNQAIPQDYLYKNDVLQWR